MPPPQGLLRGNAARSSSRTGMPARASRRAAVAPAGPAPTTSTGSRLARRMARTATAIRSLDSRGARKSSHDLTCQRYTHAESPVNLRPRSGLWHCDTRFTAELQPLPCAHPSRSIVRRLLGFGRLLVPCAAGVPVRGVAGRERRAAGSTESTASGQAAAAAVAVLWHQPDAARLASSGATGAGPVARRSTAPHAGLRLPRPLLTRGVAWTPFERRRRRDSERRAGGAHRRTDGVRPGLRPLGLLVTGSLDLIPLPCLLAPFTSRSTRGSADPRSPFDGAFVRLR